MPATMPAVRWWCCRLGRRRCAVAAGGRAASAPSATSAAAATAPAEAAGSAAVLPRNCRPPGDRPERWMPAMCPPGLHRAAHQFAGAGGQGLGIGHRGRVFAGQQDGHFQQLGVQRLFAFFQQQLHGQGGLALQPVVHGLFSGGQQLRLAAADHRHRVIGAPRGGAQHFADGLAGAEAQRNLLYQRLVVSRRTHVGRHPLPQRQRDVRGFQIEVDPGRRR